MLKFLQEVVAEVKKVSFPTRKELTRLTITVIVISAIVSLFLAGADAVFTKLLELILR
jgi:preprotein translocase subunit SecE